jgi:ABC-type nitrate/sulfonate/bicarbonate transport system permease component
MQVPLELLPAGRAIASSYLYPLAATAVLFAVWELAARLGNISPLLLPAPSAIARGDCR